MDYNQLARKYPDIGKMKRSDLIGNFDGHCDKEIRSFADDANLSLGQALNLFSPEPDNENRPSDAILDCIAYRNLRTKSEGGLLSSPVNQFFDREDTNFALGIGYLQNIFNRVLDAGIEETSDYYNDYPTPTEFAQNTRGGLPHPFNPETTGMLETNRNYQPRVMIKDVISMRRTIVGDQYEAPIVNNPSDTGLRFVGEDGSLPRYSINMDNKVTRTSEMGYELELSDKLRRSSRVTMEAIAKIQMVKAMQLENAIVNSFIQMIATGATAHGMSASPTSREIIQLHMTLNDQYMLTTFIGNILAVAEYANADIFYQSSNRRPGTSGMRNFVDSLLGNEFIAKKSDTDVPALAGATRMLAFDRRHCLDYIVEQRGTAQETYRENRERTTVIANCHSFAGHLLADADQCRLLITLSG